MLRGIDEVSYLASLIYNERNKIKFTSISEKYCIPAKFKAKQNQLHSALIEYVVSNYRNTKKFRSKVVDALNILTYCVLESEVPTFDWKVKDPLATLPDFDMDRVKAVVGSYYLEEFAIEWDVIEKDNSADQILAETEAVAAKRKPEKKSDTKPAETVPVTKLVQNKLQTIPEEIVVTPKPATASTLVETPKEDLYIQSPKYVQFDYNKPWLSVQSGDDMLTIYTTLPEIPTKQNEISVTSNVKLMTDTELMNLYPNHVIHTRSPILYDRVEGIPFDENLGCIIPINGFTVDQVRDNIIKYPHLYKLKRYSADDEIISFYEDIELEGDLESIASIWDSLPESKVIPKQSEFIKEYVVRRFILEEENGVKHRYPMYGTLDPFLTLFMPPEMYIQYGFKDVVEIAKQCVLSRVSYKRSRNPVLKRLNIIV